MKGQVNQITQHLIWLAVLLSGSNSPLSVFVKKMAKMLPQQQEAFLAWDIFGFMIEIEPIPLLPIARGSQDKHPGTIFRTLHILCNL